MTDQPSAEAHKAALEHYGFSEEKPPTPDDPPAELRKRAAHIPATAVSVNQPKDEAKPVPDFRAGRIR